MAHLLRPPVVMEAPGMDAGGRLFGRVKYPRGVSLLVTGSTVVEQRWPTIEEQQAADITYLGGHEYLIDCEAAQVLIAAGYGSCLEPAERYIDRYDPCDIYTGSFE